MKPKIYKYFLFLLFPIALYLSAYSSLYPFFALSLIFFFFVKGSTTFDIASYELATLLGSHLGYLLFTSFSLILFFMFYGALEQFVEMAHMSPYRLAPLSAFFHAKTLSITSLIIIPTITMKLIAEEKMEGTFDLLLSYPIQEESIVLGKFLGVWFYYILLWLPSLFHIFLISTLGNLDIGQMFSLYLYIFTSGGCFISIGLLSSSFFRSQLASFVVTFSLLLPFHGGVFISQEVFPSTTFLEEASRGMINSRYFVLFITLTIFMLYLTYKVLESRRYLPVKLVFPRKSILLLCLLLLCCIFFSFFLRSNIERVGYCILASLIFFRIYAGKSKKVIFFSNNLLSVYSLFIILSLCNWYSYYYTVKIDYSKSQAFKLPLATRLLIEDTVNTKEYISVIAFVGYLKEHSHEHTQRDNERYFILKEVLRKFADSLNKPGEIKFRYEFIHPVPSGKNITSYIHKNKQQHKRIATLQNTYGIKGYRDVLLMYRDRHYILNDYDLFEKRLEKDQVPKLLLLWKKIYETGGEIEPPPKDPKKAFEKLKHIANPEMLRVFPKENIESVFVNAILRLTKLPPQRVYFAQGHGEKSIVGGMVNDFKTAYRFRDILKHNNFEIRAIRLHEVQEIPRDCSVLVIMAGTNTLQYGEKKRVVLEQYLGKGGKIIIFLSAENDLGLRPFFNKYDIVTKPIIATRFYFGAGSGKPQKINTIAIEDFSHHSLNMALRFEQKKEMAYPYPFYITKARLIQAKKNSQNTFNLFEVPPNISGEPLSTNEKPYNKTFYLGAIYSRKNGMLAVIGNSLFLSDTPFYEKGMSAPIPHILMGSNRFFPPVLFRYIAPFITTVSLKKVKPIIFFPENISARTISWYLYSNILLVLVFLFWGVFTFFRK